MLTSIALASGRKIDFSCTCHFSCIYFLVAKLTLHCKCSLQLHLPTWVAYFSLVAKSLPGLHITLYLHMLPSVALALPGCAIQFSCECALDLHLPPGSYTCFELQMRTLVSPASLGCTIDSTLNAHFSCSCPSWLQNHPLASLVRG